MTDAEAKKARIDLVIWALSIVSGQRQAMTYNDARAAAHEVHMQAQWMEMSPATLIRLYALGFVTLDPRP